MGINDDDDVPHYTVGLLDAEARLEALADRYENDYATVMELFRHSTRQPYRKAVIAQDIRMVLRELNGLKQYDPR